MFRYSFLWQDNYFSLILWSFSKTMVNLLKTLWKLLTSTNSFQQFLKEVTMIYVCITFCGHSMSLSKVNTLFIVLFSTRCLKTPSWTFFIKNQPQTYAFEAFAKSLSRVPSTSSLSTAACQRSLQQDFWLTLLLCSRGSLNRNF